MRVSITTSINNPLMATFTTKPEVFLIEFD